MKLKPILPLWLLLAIAIGLLGILITRCLLAKKDTPGQYGQIFSTEDCNYTIIVRCWPAANDYRW